MHAVMLSLSKPMADGLMHLCMINNSSQSLMEALMHGHVTVTVSLFRLPTKVHDFEIQQICARPQDFPLHPKWPLAVAPDQV